MFRHGVESHRPASARPRTAPPASHRGPTDDSRRCRVHARHLCLPRSADVSAPSTPPGGPRIFDGCVSLRPAAGRRAGGDPGMELFDNSVNVAMPAEQVAKSVGLVSLGRITISRMNAGRLRAARRNVRRSLLLEACARVARHRDARGRDHAGPVSIGATRLASGRRGQAPKGTGGMPRRHQHHRRGRLRNVRGSCPTSVDPGIPVQTRGTETSQYPEEEKATATPSVAASERGPA